jgi:hypothetical protein
MTTWRYLTLLAVACVAAGCEMAVDLDNDLDAPQISFEVSSTTSDEETGAVSIGVILEGSTDQVVQVNYSLLTSGTTASAMDFEFTNGTLVFNLGDTRKEIPASIRNDNDETEVDEYFSIALSSAVGAELDQEKAIHKVLISNKILPRASVGTATSSADETQPSVMTVQLSKPAEGDTTLILTAAGGMGTGVFPASVPADANFVAMTEVTVQNGQMSAIVPLNVVNDMSDEENEQLAVSIVGSKTMNVVVNQTNKTQVHTILDEDPPPTVSWEDTTRSINENLSILPTDLVARLSVASGKTVRVDFTRDDANDSGSLGDIAVGPVSGTLTFDPGDATEGFNLFIQNDGTDEDDETALYVLSNPVNATLGSGPVCTVDLIDNDTSQVNFDDSSDTVSEGQQITVNVVLSTQNSRTVSVNFGLNNGPGQTSAQSDDYTIVTQSPLMFAPGETSKPIQINVASNAPGSEPDERVVIDIGTVTNAQRGGTTRYTLTIQD